MSICFVDIHCHLLPGMDDGAKDLEQSLAMAQLAVDDGITTIVVTPHQLGAFSKNRGEQIRRRTVELQELLDRQQIPLQVLPGADVRIEDGMIDALLDGEVLTLGDHRRHVLLELPHEMYLPLESLLARLRRCGMTGILSHPERNHGVLSQPHLLDALVEGGCLMQVTAGSLLGHFGPASKQLAEKMVRRGQVHFLATDAHGPKSRRPLMRQAFRRACEMAGEEAALAWCYSNPALVVAGEEIPAGKTTVSPPQRRWWSLRKVG